MYFIGQNGEDDDGVRRSHTHLKLADAFLEGDIGRKLRGFGGTAGGHDIDKIDKFEGMPIAAVLRNEDGKIAELRISAMAGIGMNLVRETIKEHAFDSGYSIGREPFNERVDNATVNDSPLHEAHEAHEPPRSAKASRRGKLEIELEASDTRDTVTLRSELNAVN